MMQKIVDINSVILGAATGYSPDKVLVFLNSLKVSAYNGTVVLFLNESQIEEYEIFYNGKEYPYKLEFIKTKIGIFSTSKKIGKNLKKIIHYFSAYLVSKEPNFHQDFIYYLSLPHVSRFFDYCEYLTINNNFTHVMLSDTRDVIVQENPFNNDMLGLFLGMEDSKTLIGDDSFHIKWITDVYGKSYLNTIANKQISCAGVTLGDIYSIKKYLDTMLAEFLKLPYYTMVRSNYDQGIHNKLLYSGQFDNPNLCQPLESKILTVGLLESKDIGMNEDGIILNNNGSVAQIIHQYDRHTDIESKILKKYK